MKLLLKERKEQEQIFKDKGGIIQAMVLFNGLILANAWLYSSGIVQSFALGMKEAFSGLPVYSLFVTVIADALVQDYPILLICYTVAVVIVLTWFILDIIIKIEIWHVVKDEVDDNE